MPKNLSPSKLDVHQSQKLSFEDAHDAIRVVEVLDRKHEIEISADSGDSILTVAKSRCLSPSDGAVDCSQMRKMCGYSAAVASVSADGINWSDNINMSQSTVLDLCAMQIKVVQGLVVVRS